MKILKNGQHTDLVENHNENLYIRVHGDGHTVDFKPVVKLFVCVGGNATWLLTEMDPDTGDCFGLCDLGRGYPELGYVNLNEMTDTLGWRLERDMHFTATKTITEYAADARNAGRIDA